MYTYVSEESIAGKVAVSGLGEVLEEMFHSSCSVEADEDGQQGGAVDVSDELDGMSSLTSIVTGRVVVGGSLEGEVNGGVPPSNRVAVPDFSGIDFILIF